MQPNQFIDFQLMENFMSFQKPNRNTSIFSAPDECFNSSRNTQLASKQTSQSHKSFSKMFENPVGVQGKPMQQLPSTLQSNDVLSDHQSLVNGRKQILKKRNTHAKAYRRHIRGPQPKAQDYKTEEEIEQYSKNTKIPSIVNVSQR